MLITTNQQSGKKKQSGLALLVFVIAIALAISAYYFASISLVKIQADKLNKTRIALAQAKQLLLDHAITRTDLSNPSIQLGRFGFLPCPAIDNGEGNSVGTCELRDRNSFGWFPWRSLRSIPIRDGNGDCLLYAVSGSYKFSPAANMLNEDSNGMFQIVNDTNVTIQGVTPPERVVAVVFSPGDALAGQNRLFEVGSECGNDFSNYDTAYLDVFEVSPGVFADNSAVNTGNPDEVYQFVQADVATNIGVFNDQLITITREEIWSAILARTDFNQKMSNLTEALAVCLSNYAAGNGVNRLPWPAQMNIADYRVEDNYDDIANAAQGYAGRFPFIVNNSNASIGIAGANDELFTEAACDNLLLPNGGITAHLLGVAVGSNDEYKNLWENWKDHIFYIVSQNYAPSLAAASCSGNCISVNGIPRAAAVIFAGSRVAAQVRNGPVGPDINTKQLIFNYLENANVGVFPDPTGDGAYVTAGSNDIMFCIMDGLGVTPC